MSRLTHWTTDITDRYEADVVAPAFGSTKAWQVTEVTVRLSPIEDGRYYADITLRGYALTKAGKRAQNGQYGTVYGERDEQVRYELAREALLATCARHNIAIESVEGGEIDTLPWDEYHAQRQADILRSLGIEG